MISAAMQQNRNIYMKEDWFMVLTSFAVTYLICLVIMVVTFQWQTKYHELGHAKRCKKMNLPHFICLKSKHKKSGYVDKWKTDVYYFPPQRYKELFGSTGGMCFYDSLGSEFSSLTNITWGGIIASWKFFTVVFALEIVLIWLILQNSPVFELYTVNFSSACVGAAAVYVVCCLWIFKTTKNIEEAYIKEIEKAKNTGEKVFVSISDGTKVLKKPRKEWMEAYKKYHLPNKELFLSYEDRLKQVKEYSNK